MQPEMDENYVGKEDDERIMKIVEEMECDVENYVINDIKDFFGIDFGQLNFVGE